MDDSILKDFTSLLQHRKEESQTLAIVIDQSGNVLRRVLDDSDSKHCQAFLSMTMELGLPVIETTDSFIAANHLRSQGALAIQIRDHVGVVYFPAYIAAVQYSAFEQELSSLSDTFISYDENDGLAVRSDVLEYARSLIRNREHHKKM